MVRQGSGGSSINVTSQLAEVARPERAAYVASKGGGRSLSPDPDARASDVAEAVDIEAADDADGRDRPDRQRRCGRRTGEAARGSGRDPPTGSYVAVDTVEESLDQMQLFAEEVMTRICR